MLDVAIIGGGPAALSAALNCRQRNKTVCVFGRSLDSSLLFSAEKVDNYLGMPDVNGEEMLNRFYAHAVKNGVEFQECRVSQILNVGEHYMINAENNFFEAKAVILATGLSKSKGISGEMDYLGKGVSYCATCDGMLYRNKKVVVVSENEEGEAEANFLADICKEVLYVPLYKDIAHLKDNVVVLDAKPKAVLGQSDKLTALETDKETISCDGIFFAKNTMPPDSLVFGLKTDGKNIEVDRRMATNLPNVYAAGDCTGTPYQIAKAVGEGLVAALSAVSDIDKMKKK
ncbi:NAD(P)/FAD-dependent oxidoreductase [Anaerotignum sp. MB30-C6]|uniref:NAD(P)/FAD-dependent oxidoreductase n=1 Tax=Anaerotignum sp. MB30-C6 TaxID=3070814 RepID=UPI0027DAD5B9|nr:FAD-dependent oxidoreductase [Anaerotignum sp. MB30-C6]WMI80144.1 FAD-dependent oxidoreductase [Anaerotignum sp. MB30-C6]